MIIQLTSDGVVIEDQSSQQQQQDLGLSQQVQLVVILCNV